MIREQQGNRETSADFLRSHGIEVGCVLHGDPIWDGRGNRIERARRCLITAIGEDCVLGRMLIVGDDDDASDVWQREGSISFCSRTWSSSPQPAAESGGSRG